MCGNIRGSGEGNGTPLQYSCLENPMDGGAWWAAVDGVAKSRTRLKQLSSSRKLFIKGYHRAWHLSPGLIDLVLNKEMFPKVTSNSHSSDVKRVPEFSELLSQITISNSKDSFCLEFSSPRNVYV